VGNGGIELKKFIVNLKVPTAYCGFTLIDLTNQKVGYDFEETKYAFNIVIGGI
jgi:hypothetical protein